MIDWATSTGGRLEALLLVLLGLAIVFAIVKTYHQTHALIPTLLAGLVGALAWWLAKNYLVIADKLKPDLPTNGLGGVARPVGLVARPWLAARGVQW